MTISTTKNVVVVGGNGVLTVFDYDFQMQDDDYAVLIYTDVAGVSTVVAPGAYTVSDPTNPLGGTFSYQPNGVPLVVGATLTLARVVPYTQGSSIANQGNFYPQVIEAALDFLTMQTQQLANSIGRSPLLPITVDLTTFETEMLEPVPGAVIRVKDDGSGFEWGLAPAAIGASAFGLTLVAAANRIAARSILGAGVWCGVAGGTANAITLTPATAITDYGDGAYYLWKSGAAGNNAASTIAISGLGAKAAQSNGVAMVGGEIEANKWYISMYDGANLQTLRFAPGVLLSLFSAKGSLAVGSASGKVVELVAGPDGSVPLADVSQTVGMQWVRLGAGTVRQCVLASALDANGYAAGITTGAGLKPGLDANPTSMVVTFASGFGAGGAQDLVSVLSADVADLFGVNQPINLTSYAYATWATQASVVWASTLVPPQYDYTFDRTRFSLLHCEGANGGAVITDDWGNSPTLNNGATTVTTASKFGASCVQLGNAADKYVKLNSLVGTRHPVESGFTYEAWINADSVPGGASNLRFLYCPVTAGANDGLQLYFSDSTHISLALAGATTNSNAFAAITIGVWHHVALCWDPIALKMYLYWDGVKILEVAATIASFAVRGDFRWGNLGSAAGFGFDGKIDEIRCSPFCVYPAGTAFAAPGAAFAVTDNVASFFSIPEMKMYEITGIAAGAGQNPAMTQKNRTFVAEFDASGAAITVVRNYALKGQFSSTAQVLPASGTVSVNHNIGVRPKIAGYRALCKTITVGLWTAGDEVRSINSALGGSAGYSGAIMIATTRAAVRACTYLNNTIYDKAGATGNQWDPTQWDFFFECDRGW